MMKNGIDPRIALALNIILAVGGAITTASAQLTSIFGSSTGQLVVTIAGIIVATVGAVNAALNNYSSTVAGPGVVNK